MNELLNNLLKLQAIDFEETPVKFTPAEIEAARALIPPQILGHYDRLVARGKKGVALVRNQVCTGCHMRLPIGTINTLMQGTDIRLCDTCGRYLYLPPLTEEAPAAAVPQASGSEIPIEKPAKRPRKRKTAAKVVKEGEKVAENVV